MTTTESGKQVSMRVSIDVQNAERLEAMAEKQCLSKSAIIRLALMEYFHRHDK